MDDVLPTSLAKWNRFFSVGKPGYEPRKEEWMYRFVYFFYAPKWLLFCNILLVTLYLVDAIKFDDDEAARRLPMRNAVACYSSAFGHIILVYRQKTLLQALNLAREAAGILSKDAPPEVKEQFRIATHRKGMFVWRFYPVYSSMMAVTGSLATFTAPSVVNEILREKSEILVLMKCILESYTLSATCACVTGLLIVVVDVHYTCAVLCTELGRRMETEKGVANTGRTAATYSLVIAASRAVNTATGYLLPHYVMATFVVPLLSTFSIVTKPEVADIFDVVSFPLLFLFFGPICEASQRMQNASSAMAGRTYAGPWLDEAPPCRRVRLQIMLQCNSRPVSFKVEGLGSMNRPLGRKIATSWFQYLQVLQNLRPVN